HLAELAASLAESAELFDGLSQQSLQRLEVTGLDNGMWSLSGELASETGRMFAKLLQTAVPPPRQDEVDADGVLPPAANRNAEALHHMLSVYGTDPDAATRHGHTCTLNVTVDI
ncbi:13E12 repeat family protein, partial [Glycomyces sp. L485]|uniref:13E12 repeat family protein n=1 Tax=Glycomyces sp. L485 TaxID=2909235 RepID=UPI001F4A65E8